MVMIVVVIMAVRAGGEAVFRFDRGLKLLASHFAVAHLGLVEQEIDHLVFIQWRAQLGGRHRLLLNVLDEALAIFRAVLLRSLGDQAVHFLLAHLDAIGLADLGKQQAQAHAALGDRLIIVALGFHFLHRRSRVFLVRGFMLELRPDLLELGIDHRRRHREIMTLGQLVEQLALHVRAGELVVLLLDLALQQALELIEAFKAQRFRQILVDLALAGGLHRLDRQVERRRLPLQRIDIVIRRERHLDGLFLAGLHADQLILEPGDQAARSDLHRHVLAGAAVERRAIDLADEIHHHQVAGRGLVALRGVFPALLLIGELLELLVDRRIVHRHGQPLELELVDRRGRHVGQHFQRHLDLGILAGRIAFAQLDRGLHRGAQLVIGDDLLHAFLDRRVERVGGERLAVHLADQVGGHLAGSKAGHAHLRRDALDLGVDALVDVLGGDRQGVGALQAFVQRLDSLHSIRAFISEIGKTAPPHSCGGPGAGEGTRTPTSFDTGT